MLCWTELTSICPACGMHACRVQADEDGQKYPAPVYCCAGCGLFWVLGDHYWIERESAEDEAESIGLPRDKGVPIALRIRLETLTHLASRGRSKSA